MHNAYASDPNLLILIKLVKINRKNNNSKRTNSIVTKAFKGILPWFLVVRREREKQLPMKPQFLLL